MTSPEPVSINMLRLEELPTAKSPNQNPPELETPFTAEASRRSSCLLDNGIRPARAVEAHAAHAVKATGKDDEKYILNDMNERGESSTA